MYCFSKNKKFFGKRSLFYYYCFEGNLSMLQSFHRYFSRNRHAMLLSWHCNQQSLFTLITVHPFICTILSISVRRNKQGIARKCTHIYKWLFILINTREKETLMVDISQFVIKIIYNTGCVVGCQCRRYTHCLVPTSYATY